MLTETISFISLFAGIGGLDLGLERAGMNCVAQVEIDDFCQKVLCKHWPNVPKFKDVRDVGKHNLPAAALVCGGFPCQDVALIGDRDGLSGKRSTLWFEFLRIIREIRPRWVLVENVPGLLSSDDGEFFASIFRGLSQSGYDAEWQTLSASAFGAPHPRERIFILAYPKSESGLQACPVIDSTRKSIETWNHAMRLPWAEMASKDWELHQSYVVREIDGIPGRMDRARSLGNAVVPQVAEFVGRCIMEWSR